jgi:hypothetical protein
MDEERSKVNITPLYAQKLVVVNWHPAGRRQHSRCAVDDGLMGVARSKPEAQARNRRYCLACASGFDYASHVAPGLIAGGWSGGLESFDALGCFAPVPFKKEAI